MKILWLTATLLIVTALLVLSCGPRAPAPAPTTPTPATPAPAAPTPTPVAPAPAPIATLTEKPRYGGTMNVLRDSDLGNLDAVVNPASEDIASGLLFDVLLQPDWGRGMGGTREFDHGGMTAYASLSDGAAESWKVVAANEWVFQLRKGIHWALDPSNEASRLVNGREVTIDDWVYNLERYNGTPTSGIRAGQPRAALGTTVTKTGPWELTMKIEPIAEGFNGWFWLVPALWTFHAPEVIKKYGDGRDWRNRVGTGPWMIADYVAGGAITLKKNPNYWKRNPSGPGKGDQLPYVDTAKLLIVFDLSTRLAAMRTGRADWIDGVEGEDARGLLKTTPRLQSYKYLPEGLGVGMRTDKKELPFSDVRVRQALTMAIDYDGLVNDLYGGEAEKFIWPLPPTYKESYVPLEKLPEKLQALYKYNPEGAKKLLAEAGYPKGFKTKIIVRNITSHMDSVAAIKAMWAKIGVDLEIQPRETAVYNSIQRGRTHEEMIFSSAHGTSYTVILGLGRWRGSVWTNVSFIGDPPERDPVVENTYQKMGQYLLVDMPKAEQMVRDLVPHLVEQAYLIGRPTPYSYRLWQPWVKNYYGESSIPMLITNSWIDGDLKEQTIGRR